MPFTYIAKMSYNKAAFKMWSTVPKYYLNPSTTDRICQLHLPFLETPRRSRQTSASEFLK